MAEIFTAKSFRKSNCNYAGSFFNLAPIKEEGGIIIDCLPSNTLLVDDEDVAKLISGSDELSSGTLNGKTYYILAEKQKCSMIKMIKKIFSKK